jgi:hypothetical protein
MRKLILLLLLGTAVAQTYVTPNLSANNVFTGTNQFSAGAILGPFTAASLPGGPGAGTVAVVTDGAPGSSPCTGGSTGALGIYVGGVWSCLGISGSFPASAALGDTLRYNIYGDSKWDAALAGAGISLGWYNDQTQGVPICYGAVGCSHPTAEGSYGNVFANGTNSAGSTYSAAATASTSDVIGMDVGAGANYGDWGFGGFYRITFSWAAGNTANVRYWLGMTAFNTGGAGCSTTPPRSTTCYATNTPNTSALAFRYSAGTDTHWQAVSINAGTATVVDTGVAPNTSPHLFEIAAAASGTGYNYYIDGALVGVITTNLPSVTAQASNTETILFWAGDNENTATAISGTSYWTSMSEK